MATLIALLAFTLPAWAADDRLTRPVEDEIIYFVMPDRFANGDAGNDTGGIEGGPYQHGFDPAHKGFYHGGDLVGLRQKLDYIQGLGVTALWLTPIFVNKPVQGPPGHLSSGYHGYWITDFTDVDPHLGTRGEFRELIKDAHARGMRVFLDIVTNHTADVIHYRECLEVDEGSGVHWSDCAYRSRADFPYTTRGGPDGETINPGFAGTGPEHQTEENFARLVDPNYAYTPFVPEADAGIKNPEWLNDLTYYHNRGNSHWEGESSLLGDFSGLDDLFTEHPRVVGGMIEIYRHWIREYRIDGFRIDTVRHVDDAFWQRFVPAMLEQARESGIPNFYIFGEAWAPDPAELARFTHHAAMPAVLDFAFQSVAQKVIVDGEAPRLLQQLFEQDHMYAGGTATARQLPIFIGNHDMGRIGHFLLEAHGHGADDEMLFKRAELGHALMLFARGVPVIYYGDEQGFTGHGGDQDARQDMFPSRVDVYNDNRLIGTEATTADDNFDTTHPLYRAIAAMAGVYHAEPGLRRGEQTVRLAEDEAGLLAFTRGRDDDDHRYLVVLNTAERPRQGDVPVVDDEWIKLIGSGTESLQGGDGRVRVELPDLSYAVYRSVAGENH